MTSAPVELSHREKHQNGQSSCGFPFLTTPQKTALQTLVSPRLSILAGQRPEVPRLTLARSLAAQRRRAMTANAAHGRHRQGLQARDQMRHSSARPSSRIRANPIADKFHLPMFHEIRVGLLGYPRMGDVPFDFLEYKVLEEK